MTGETYTRTLSQAGGIPRISSRFRESRQAPKMYAWKGTHPDICVMVGSFRPRPLAFQGVVVQDSRERVASLGGRPSQEATGATGLSLFQAEFDSPRPPPRARNCQQIPGCLDNRVDVTMGSPEYTIGRKKRGRGSMKQTPVEWLVGASGLEPTVS
jgi:hypothetical protein